MPILQMKKLRTAVTEGLAQSHADASTLHRHSWSARSPNSDLMHYSSIMCASHCMIPPETKFGSRILKITLLFQLPFVRTLSPLWHPDQLHAWWKSQGEVSLEKKFQSKMKNPALGTYL